LPSPSLSAQTCPELVEGWFRPAEGGQACLPRTAEPGSTGAGVLDDLIGDVKAKAGTLSAGRQVRICFLTLER